MTLNITASSSEPRTIITQVPMRVAKAGDVPEPGAGDDGLQPSDATPQPAPGANAQCQTLSLVLTPQDLDILGLPIQLDAVNVDLTAVRNTGQLAKLLCTVSGLFEGAAPATEIASALNTVLDAIG